MALDFPARDTEERGYAAQIDIVKGISLYDRAGAGVLPYPTGDRPGEEHCAWGFVCEATRQWTAGVDRARAEIKAAAKQELLDSESPLLGDQARQAMVTGRQHWRNRLSGFVGVVDALTERGVRVEEIKALPTTFIRWEVGGTYRHRTMIVCDTEAVRALGVTGGDKGMSPQGGREVRQLFGCSSRSRSGVIFHPNGIEIFSDQ